MAERRYPSWCYVKWRTQALVTGITIIILAVFSIAPILWIVVKAGFSNEKYEDSTKLDSEDILYQVFWILQLVFASLLIHGVRKNNATFLKIWIYFQIFLIVCNIRILVWSKLMSLHENIIFSSIGNIGFLCWIYVVFRFYVVIRINDLSKVNESKLENV